MERNCKEVSGEKVYYVNENDFMKLEYMEKQPWYKKLFLGGYCYPSSKIIYIRWSRRHDLKLLCHERGHLKGWKHTWIPGYIMFPYWVGRGWKV